MKKRGERERERNARVSDREASDIGVPRRYASGLSRRVSVRVTRGDKYRGEVQQRGACACATRRKNIRPQISTSPGANLTGANSPGLARAKEGRQEGSCRDSRKKRER